MRKKRLKVHFGTTGVEDILNVAYRLDQTAAFKKSTGLALVPTVEWLQEQAKILRRALEKEGLSE